MDTITKVYYKGWENLERLGERLRSQLLSEIDLLEKDYAVIQDFRSNVEYDVSNIKGTLQSFKDHLSKTRSLVSAFLITKGEPITTNVFQIQPILQALDSALTLIEAFPKENPRKLLQLSLTMSNVKIEDVMSSITTLKEILKA